MRHDPFVACFCEQPDLLGQWAYFARDGGYNVGFRRAQLTAVVGPDGYALSRVIYDPADQRKILVSAVEQFENLVATQLGSVNSPLQMAGAASSAAALVIAVRNLAIGMKAPGFEPEKEWRLVTFASEGSGIDGDPDGVEDAKNMAFRTVGGRIVPYFKAAYGPGGPPVVSITIGPTVDAEIAKDSITRILKGRGYRWREIEVQASKITLRE
jgi:hypothetical protein